MTSSRYAWGVVALLWVVALLNYVDRQVIFSLFPLLRADLHISDAELGLAGAAFLWVYALASPFAGFLADRYGRKRVVVSSLLIWSAITWATGHARSFNQLLAARALMGISEACYLPAALALIAAHHGEATRSRATGLHYTGIYVGVVLGGVGGGWMGANYGWRSPFFLLGALGIVYALVLVLLLKENRQAAHETPAPPTGFFASARKVLSLPAFPVLLIVFAAKSVGDWLVYAWMPLYLYENFGMSLAQSGFSATFWVQAASVGGIAIGGFVADRWSLRSSQGRIFTQALGLAAAAPFLFLVGIAGTPALLITGLIVFGLGRGIFDCNAMPVLCQVAPPELRSTGFGLLNLAGTFSGGVIAAAAGALKATFGLGLLLQFSGLLLLGSAFLLWRLRLTSHHFDSDPARNAAIASDVRK